ncbi:MAG: M48 family peptidase [Alphaproteobacteria bacterium]|nr:MAG: M48 family peptidase [Alphaproteobacteria bacterium]
MAEQIITVGTPPLEVVIRRSGRARRLSLRVSRLDGRVTLTLPPGASPRQARAFAEEKADWIRRALAARPEDERPMPGGTVPFRGARLPIVAGPGRSVRLEGGVLAVPARDPERTPARLAAFFRLEAREAVAEAVARYGERLGRMPSAISLRDTRSRWGSCTAEGRLMLSWRLIMAPPPVLDYVVAHEMAHLVHMDHSPAFWSTVARLMPGHEAHRAWLRTHGAALHAVRLRD